ncbi:MAG: putative mannose-1-phosphate guanylyltransferase [Acidimicrobiaceae bacterium]|nr:MAG: putative mannose-1-phosphate guanylyltransferase [Acidimicrobiaceae bacterium]
MMRAVVLVGGIGTRLRPLTYSVPKPMLPVGHVSIIERLITNLVGGGVTDVTLALGFKPEPFIEAFPDGTCAGAQLRYAVEPEPLDTAGAIRFAAEAVGIDDTFVVANGDVLTDLDISALVDFHRSHGAEATLHLIAVDDPSAFGVVAIDDDGRVRRFVEKPAAGTEPSNLINAGTYVLEASVLGRIPTGRKVSIERSTFPAIVAEGLAYAYATDDYWIDTGMPDLYLAANLDLVSGRRSGQSCVGVHPAASVHPTALVERSVVAAGTCVANDARVVDSVLLAGATIGAGSCLSRSVVMGRIGAGATVHDSVIGADGAVADGEHIAHQRRPDPARP